MRLSDSPSLASGLLGAWSASGGRAGLWRSDSNTTVLFGAVHHPAVHRTAVSPGPGMGDLRSARCLRKRVGTYRRR